MTAADLQALHDLSVAGIYCDLALGGSVSDYASEDETGEAYLIRQYGHDIGTELAGQTQESARRWCKEALKIRERGALPRRGGWPT